MVFLQLSEQTLGQWLAGRFDFVAEFVIEVLNALNFVALALRQFFGVTEF